MAFTTMVQPFAVQMYTVIVHEAQEGGYWAEVKELPGCVSQGETLEEVRDNIIEAIDAVMESSDEGPSVFQVEPVSGYKTDFVFGSDETWTATR